MTITFTIAFSWLAVHGTISAIFFCILYGTTAAASATLRIITVVCQYLTPEAMGGRMGIDLFVIGSGVLLGSPIAGAVVKSG